MSRLKSTTRFGLWVKAAIAALCLVGVGFAISAAAQASSSAGALRVRLGGDQVETRVVIDLDRSVRAELVSDGADGREVVLSFPRVDAGDGQRGAGQGLVRRWSVEQAGGSANLRIELARDAQVRRRFLLPPGDGVKEYRYVIDLVSSGPSITEPGKPESRVAVITKARATTRKIIVIDAGHGGKDPGAIGKLGPEKDITLAAAKALKARLERSGRYTVILTRPNDVYVPLESRVLIARKADADLFISLHADSGPETARGASVYTLSDKGEGRVNKVLRKDDWIMDASLSGSDRTVSQILLDLTQRSTKNRSAGFAEGLLKEISTVTPLLRRSHRDASLVVLLAPDVPAVLLEMGFVSNPDDEKALRDPQKRGLLMEAVADSIDNWFMAEARFASR